MKSTFQSYHCNTFVSLARHKERACLSLPLPWNVVLLFKSLKNNEKCFNFLPHLLASCLQHSASTYATHLPAIILILSSSSGARPCGCIFHYGRTVQSVYEPLQTTNSETCPSLFMLPECLLVKILWIFGGPAWTPSLTGSLPSPSSIGESCPDPILQRTCFNSFLTLPALCLIS